MADLKSPFRLIIELKTPIQLGRYPVRLDGLLWHALYLHRGCVDKARESLADYLATAVSEHRYYHAGSLHFGVLGDLPEAGIVDTVLGLQTSKIGNMRSGRDLCPTKFSPNGRNGRYTKVVKVGGAYKTRLNPCATYFAQYLLFDGVGYGDRIADLIEFYVPAIGVNANSGMGTIGAVRSQSLPSDTSLIESRGKPARPLPIDDFRAGTGKEPENTGMAQLVPPFRNHLNQADLLCALPDRIRQTLIAPPKM